MRRTPRWRLNAAFEAYDFLVNLISVVFNKTKYMVKEEFMACMFLNAIFMSLNFSIQKVSWM